LCLGYLSDQFRVEFAFGWNEPESTDAAGINVYRLRTIALMIGSGLIAVEVLSFSIAQLGTFTFGIVNGRGWVLHCPDYLCQLGTHSGFWGALLFGGVSLYRCACKPPVCNCHMNYFWHCLILLPSLH